MNKLNKYENIKAILKELEEKIILQYRDFHKYPELGWMEFRTASLVAKKLFDLGYEVKVGREVIDEKERVGLPSAEALAAAYERAIEQGAEKKFLAELKGGFTGVVGVLKNGEGPTYGFRFDIDALPIEESEEPNHLPRQEGFASVNPGIMHACGHDAHTAIGLGLAEVLVRLKQDIKGTVKLIFQPCEEGLRGAKPMVSAGVVDDIDYLFAQHVKTDIKPGEIIPGRDNFLATTKFNVVFHGQNAHSGTSPECGKNALLAAATAITNLYAIARNSEGATRINVGQIKGGSARNIIVARVELAMETRGGSLELDQYMYDNAINVLKSAAEMHGCCVEIIQTGGAGTASCDDELQLLIKEIVEQTDCLSVADSEYRGGSEDFPFMMQRVQKLGGLTTFMGTGARLEGAGGAHSPDFAIDDSALRPIVTLLSLLVFNTVDGEA